MVFTDVSYPVRMDTMTQLQYAMAREIKRLCVKGEARIYRQNSRRATMKIKAAVVRQKSGPFVMEEIELDDPREDEALVRIVASGLCHTDLVARDQYMPIPLPAVLGHEGAGMLRVRQGQESCARRPRRFQLSFLRRLQLVPERPTGLLSQFLPLQFLRVAPRRLVHNEQRRPSRSWVLLRPVLLRK